MNDPVYNVLAERAALDRGFTESLFLSGFGHALLVAGQAWRHPGLGVLAQDEPPARQRMLWRVCHVGFTSRLTS